MTDNHIERVTEAVARAMFGLTTPSMCEAIARQIDAAGLLASPEREREAAAKAWSEGYDVATDDFLHSDYCGRRCKCGGKHGQANPYREAKDEP